MSIPASYALALYRGDTFALDVKVWSDAGMTVPADLTGATAAAQLRAETGGALVATMACAVAAPNIVHVTLAAAGWPATAPERCRWDLQLTYPSGSVRTILAGPAQVVADVTVAA